MTNAESADAPHENAASHEQEDRPNPRIWVGSWLDYNNGVLHGAWLSANREEADLRDDIEVLLTRSPTAARTGEQAEDWGIFDFENFGTVRPGEQEDLEWLTRVGRGIAEHGMAFAAWAEAAPREEAGPDFTESYVGHYDSVEAYVDQLVADLGYDRIVEEAIPRPLRSYVRFDVELLARDLQLGGDIYVVAADKGGVWIFTG